MHFGTTRHFSMSCNEFNLIESADTYLSLDKHLPTEKMKDWKFDTRPTCVGTVTETLGYRFLSKTSVDQFLLKGTLFSMSLNIFQEYKPQCTMTGSSAWLQREVAHKLPKKSSPEEKIKTTAIKTNYEFWDTFTYISQPPSHLWFYRLQQHFTSSSPDSACLPS